MILTEICAHVRNYFVPENKRSDRSFIHAGDFEISDGKILNIDFIKENQYFRIVNSCLNDGVFCNCPEDLKKLKNEKFSGAICEMNVPSAFVELCQEIQAWRTKNETPESLNMSPFISESFAGYSYTKSNLKSDSNSVTWQKQFSERLNLWRKI